MSESESVYYAALSLYLSLYKRKSALHNIIWQFNQFRGRYTETVYIAVLLLKKTVEVLNKINTMFDPEASHYNCGGFYQSQYEILQDGFWLHLHKTWTDYWMGLQGAGPGVQETRGHEL